MILGLDPAKRATGWAVLTMDGERKASGTYRAPKTDHEGALLVAFDVWLLEMLESFAIDVVAFEQVWQHRGFRDATAYISARAMILLEATQAGKRIAPIAFSTVKKHATGSGRASKGDMRNAARRRWRISVGHDEADALWIADCCRDRLNSEPKGWTT